MKRDWRVSTGPLEVEVHAEGWLDALALALPELGFERGVLGRLQVEVDDTGGAVVRDPVIDVEILVEPLGDAPHEESEDPFTSYPTMMPDDAPSFVTSAEDVPEPAFLKAKLAPPPPVAPPAAYEEDFFSAPAEAPHIAAPIARPPEQRPGSPSRLPGGVASHDEAALPEAQAIAPPVAPPPVATPISAPPPVVPAPPALPPVAPPPVAAPPVPAPPALPPVAPPPLAPPPVAPPPVAPPPVSPLAPPKVEGQRPHSYSHSIDPSAPPIEIAPPPREPPPPPAPLPRVRPPLGQAVTVPPPSSVVGPPPTVALNEPNRPPPLRPLPSQPAGRPALAASMSIPPKPVQVDDDVLEDLFLRLGEISTARGVAGASGIALRILLDLVPSGAGAVLIKTHTGEGLRFRAASGPAAGQIIDTVIPIDRGIAGYVCQLGVGLTIGDVAKDKRHYGKVDRSTGFATRAILAVPVRSDNGAIYGVLELLNPPAPFSGEQFEIATRVAVSLGTFLNSVDSAR